MDLKKLHMLVFPLLLVGALNWGLVGLLDYNLVESLLGSWPMAVKVVYIAVGLAAVHAAIYHKEECKTCGEMMKK